MREELNISVGSGEIPVSPDIDVFSQSEIGEKMIQIIGHKKLIPIMNIDIKEASMASGRRKHRRGVLL